jgi:4-hydroxybutyryl-CoA dehydratase/vinylacetyl-CoA-Delta-isomerase
MGIRTRKEYLDSLRDGRVVYVYGEKVEDVTTHPILKLTARGCAMEFALAEDPRYRELFVEQVPDGEPVSFVFLPPRNVENLIRRRKILQTLVRTTLGRFVSAKLVGNDVLSSLTIVSRRIDKKLGTNYSERVEAYRKHLMDNDLTVAGAMSDVKGDRSLRPSDQVTHKDYYVRIVEEKSDGIVVRGSKIHIGKGPVSNEIFVCPTRALREVDKEYAVSFALPANTPGVIQIARGPDVFEEGYIHDHPFNMIYSGAQSMVIFDDVFVPMERVFLKGEWEFSGDIVHMFSNFHRLTSDAYKYPEVEILVGLGALLAEYNGLERVRHIRDKLAWLISYAEATEALGLMACHHCIVDPDFGLAYPNPMYSNIAKLFHADNYSQAIKIVEDIGGGILATVPSFRDFENPETRTFIEKYLGGKDGVPTEHRLRAILAARDFCNCFNTTAAIHAEGSLAAQYLSIHSLGDINRYKAAARRMAGISDGKEHPLFKDLPSYPFNTEWIINE